MRGDGVLRGVGVQLQGSNGRSWRGAARGLGLGWVVALGLIVSGIASGCKKTVLPADAKAVLSKALDALKEKRVDGYLAAVVPAQRAKFEGFIRGARYFTTVTGYSISDENLEVKPERIEALVTFTFPEAWVGVHRVILVKKDAKWWIDFAQIHDWQMRPGGNRFMLTKLSK